MAGEAILAGGHRRAIIALIDHSIFLGKLKREIKEFFHGFLTT